MTGYNYRNRLCEFWGAFREAELEPDEKLRELKREQVKTECHEAGLLLTTINAIHLAVLDELLEESDKKQ